MVVNASVALCDCKLLTHIRVACKFLRSRLLQWAAIQWQPPSLGYDLFSSTLITRRSKRSPYRTSLNPHYFIICGTELIPGPLSPELLCPVPIEECTLSTLGKPKVLIVLPKESQTKEQTIMGRFAAYFSSAPFLFPQPLPKTLSILLSLPRLPHTPKHHASRLFELLPRAPSCICEGRSRRPRPRRPQGN
jgi:hypothetical protein